VLCYNRGVQQTVGRRYLYLLVFTSGFVTLGVELSASRLLDPWFGNSMVVWASLIGMILLYLAVGYWLGGRIADRSPYPLTMLRMAALGAAGIGVVPTLARPVLRMASDGLADFDAALLAGSMAGILVLFAVPVTLLACVNPFAIRLTMGQVEGSGRVAGRVYALSTSGSILGCFLPVLLLIPMLGTRGTFALLAGILLLVILAGLLRLRRLWDALAVVAILGLVAWLGWRPAGPIKPASGLLYEKESRFNYIQVLDAGVERQLRLNEGEGIHSVYRPSGGLADGIWDYFLIAPAFNPAPYEPAQVRRVCIVGLAAGTMVQLFTEAYGPIPIEGAELDPEIISVGRRWFGMNQSNLRAVAADGRRFLRDGSEPCDVIAVDAYRPPYIPFHLTTVEFFTLARDRLAENGVVAVNVGRTHTDYSLVDAIAATMGQVFPSVYVMDEPDQGSLLGNSLVIATRNRTSLDDLRSNLSRFDEPLLAEVVRRAVPQARIADPPQASPIFTDDHAPVELVVHRLVLNYMFGSD
jgi:spermidine synthase